MAEMRSGEEFQTGYACAVWCALGLGAPDEERSWEQMGRLRLLHKIVTALWSQKAVGRR